MLRRNNVNGALRYLARYESARVARLIFVGATGPRVVGENGITAQMVDELLAQFTSDFSGWIEANTEPFAPGTPRRVNDWMAAMMLDCSRRAVIDLQRTIALTDLTADAAALTVPLTIVHGDRDVSAPIKTSARDYAVIVPNAELVVYEGVVHGVMVTDARRLADDIARRVRA